MPTPPLNPPVADLVPTADSLTDYDRAHLVTYLRLLDAESDGADWREVATLVLGFDVAADLDRAEAAWRSHLERARWMSASGYRALLRDARPD